MKQKENKGQQRGTKTKTKSKRNICTKAKGTHPPCIHTTTYRLTPASHHRIINTPRKASPLSKAIPATLSKADRLCQVPPYHMPAQPTEWPSSDCARDMEGYTYIFTQCINYMLSSITSVSLAATCWVIPISFDNRPLANMGFYTQNLMTSINSQI